MLKNIYIILEYKEYMESFALLGRQLEADGVRVSCFTMEQLFSGGNIPVRPQDAWEAKVKSGDWKACLWITDNGTLAGKLACCEFPVLIFLHAGNQDQDLTEFRFAMENPEEQIYFYLNRVYQRLRNIPWEITVTKRCLIRETKESDVDAFYQIYSAPAIVRFMENLYPEIEAEKRYIREYIEKVYCFYEFGIWTVTLRETGEVIGRAGFCYREGYEEPEMGFIIGVHWQRQGLAYEVCSALIEYAREELQFDKICVFVDPGNEASFCLCRKLGFVETGEVKEDGKQYIRMISG